MTDPLPAVAAVVSKDPRTCMLRKGDLVRVSERRLKSNRNDGGLGRIFRSIPIMPTSPDQHPFRYDVDWVLGGRRLTNVERQDLVYTTADAEGLTEDTAAMRARRARTTIGEKEDDKTSASPKKKKAPAKKKKPAAAAKKKGGTKSTTAAPKAKEGAKRKTTKETNKKTKRQKTEPTASNSQQDANATQEDSSMQNLFDRHRREFERQFARLKKADTFAFFLEEAPPEFDEKYDSDHPTNAGKSTGDDDSPMPDASVEAKIPTSNDTVFPSHPPYNWEMVRRRMEKGRYFLDRVRQAEEERKRIRSSEGLPPTGKAAPGNASIDLVNPLGVHWDFFRQDIAAMCDAAIARDPEGTSGGSGTLGHAADKIKGIMEQMYQKFGRKQQAELGIAESRRRFAGALKATSNTEAAMQGNWRQKPFPERKYERLRDNVVCAGLSELDERTAIYELETSLPDSFVGLSYTFNDTGQSERWMKSVATETGATGDNGGVNDERRVAEAMRADDGVVRAQVQASMSTLLIGVQDRVMTDVGVLNQPELRSANWDGDESHSAELAAVNGISLSRQSPTEPPDIVEQPVWGIDCYTRRNITTCLEVDFEPEITLEFIERWLLPAINACPVDLAFNLASAARILEGLPLPKLTESDINKENLIMEHADEDCDERWSHSLLGRALKAKLNTSAPAWLKLAARRLREAIGALGYDFFRVHPKGHGSIVLKSRLKANSLVTFYRGEVYPSWRWGEKMDAIDMSQERLGLKPNLPDFYNMALERPQQDPRGYGLLIVDASRKAGHGSSLSHSCSPTCEVRVAALGGKLCLAMTTNRDLELGEELTFDYNAVTESLGEYQSAVCLCGHGKCRGSFLHFATADCYQEVLNRNFPVAVRFANLVKGCTKQVMSEDDMELLKEHGFGTAAFGAVSVSGRNHPGSVTTSLSDSLDNIPIWLRTYVADTLRYIEYERRALPVSLLCNHFSTQMETGEQAGSRSNDPQSQAAKPEQKPFGKSNIRQYFSQKQRPLFLEQLRKQGLGDLKGPERVKALRKVASSAWDALDEGSKKRWEKEARAEWHVAQKAKRIDEKKPSAKRKADDKSQHANKKVKAIESDLGVPKISFEAADAEGFAAMEQRIQQLTQALSRVGRVLDRHRESLAQPYSSQGDGSTPAIHAPLTLLPDDDVIDWIWTQEKGVVQTLLRCCEAEPCVSPTLNQDIRAAVTRHSSILKDDNTVSPTRPSLSHEISSKRRKLNRALLNLREILLGGALAMEIEMRSYQLERQRKRDLARREASKDQQKQQEQVNATFKAEEATGVRAEVSLVLQSMVDTVVAKARDEEETTEDGRSADDFSEVIDDVPMSPWLVFYHNKWKLEAAADLLIFYIHTTTFFVPKLYQPLVSTPIEVYARELGNQVPRSIIDKSHVKKESFADEMVQIADSQDDSAKGKKSKKSRFCEPDDVIANVTVTYQGDFVLSQLLQWSNGGIGQKSGLPDLLGCVTLPGMSGCWRDLVSKKGFLKKLKSDHYRSVIRPLLVDWLSKPQKRGSPLPEAVRRFFSGASSQDKDVPVVFGSPVLDLLVLAREHGIQKVLDELQEGSKSQDEDEEGVSSKSAADRLQSTVDEGMPAQAVANWVQCENPDCLKWRRLPWHVDVDALPEKFFCSDNKWNPAANSCDAPEDTWDENDDTLKNHGFTKDSDAEMLAGASEENYEAHSPEKPQTREIKDSDFVIGARFDVFRPGKKRYFGAIVIDKKMDGGTTKWVKFHYNKVSSKFDEWIGVGSPRIAPYLSKQHDAKMETKQISEAKKQTQAKVPSEKPKKSFDAKALAVPPASVSQKAQNGPVPAPTVQREVSHAMKVQVLATRICQTAGNIADTLLKKRCSAAQVAPSISAVAAEKQRLVEMVIHNSTQIAESIIESGSLESGSIMDSLSGDGPSSGAGVTASVASTPSTTVQHSSSSASVLTSTHAQTNPTQVQTTMLAQSQPHSTTSPAVYAYNSNGNGLQSVPLSMARQSSAFSTSVYAGQSGNVMNYQFAQSSTIPRKSTPLAQQESLIHRQPTLSSRGAYHPNMLGGTYRASLYHYAPSVGGMPYSNMPYQSGNGGIVANSTSGNGHSRPEQHPPPVQQPPSDGQQGEQDKDT